MKVEDILPRPEHLTNEVIVEMKSVGLNPLIKAHYFKYLAWKDEPDKVKLWEGPEWKFEITEEQYAELEKLIESFNKMDGTNEMAMLALINDKLQEFLPECKIMPTDEKSKYLVERIIKDEPIYFKNNATFNEKLKKSGLNKRDEWKPDYLVFWEDKLFAASPSVVSFIDQLEEGEDIETMRSRYHEHEVKKFEETDESVRELIINLDKAFKELNYE